MGNKAVKFSCRAPSQEGQRAENDGSLASPSAGESSSSPVQPRAVVHCTEVLIVHITPEENKVYFQMPPEETEGESPQENFTKSGEMPSVPRTSGSSEAASGTLGEANVASELADSTTETFVKTNVQPSGLDLLCEACQLLLSEGSPTSPPKTYKESSSAEHTLDLPAVSEEKVAAELASAGTLPVGTTEPWKGTKDLHPSSDLSNGTEVPGSDQKVSCETDLELTTDNIQEQASGQREPDEAALEKSPQRTDGPHPNLRLAETPDRPAVLPDTLAKEQLPEGQTDPLNHPPSSVSEMEGEIPEECSAAGSREEKEGLCPPNEVSVETELQPNDQTVPCRMGLELTPESAQVAPEESTNEQRQLDEDVSPEKAVDIESRLDSTLVETSGGASPGAKQPSEEQSVPGCDLPLAGTMMEGEVSGDCSVAENMGETTKAVDSQLKIQPAEAQDEMLAQVDVGDETTCPIASQEKELERTTLTTQSLSAAEERPSSHVQLRGDADFLDVAPPDEASPTVDTALPNTQSFVQAQPRAEVTTVRPSPEAPLGTAEPVKEIEEAIPGQPLAEETIEQAGSPEAPRPPETAPLSGAPSGVAPGEEEEETEFFEATDTCKAAQSSSLGQGSGSSREV